MNSIADEEVEEKVESDEIVKEQLVTSHAFWISFWRSF
jgi:hypothetical protein